MTMQAAQRKTQGTSEVQRLRFLLVAAEHVERIGARIRERREDLRLSRRQLAHKMKGRVSENDIYRWERGQHRPQDTTLGALADALEVSVAYFLVDEPTPPVDLMTEFRQAEVGTVTTRLDQIDAGVRDLREKLDRLLDAVGAKPPGGGLAEQMQRMTEQVEAALSLSLSLTQSPLRLPVNRAESDDHRRRGTDVAHTTLPHPNEPDKRDQRLKLNRRDIPHLQPPCNREPFLAATRHPRAGTVDRTIVRRNPCATVRVVAPQRWRSLGGHHQRHRRLPRQAGAQRMY